MKNQKLDVCWLGGDVNVWDQSGKIIVRQGEHMVALDETAFVNLIKWEQVNKPFSPWWNQKEKLTK